MADPAERYRETMGKEPPSDPFHPLAGQWDYRGKRDEREQLRAELAGEVAEDETDEIPFIDGQESLL